MIRHACQRDAPSVRLGDCPADGQTKPNAAPLTGPTGIDPIESVEERA